MNTIPAIAGALALLLSPQIAAKENLHANERAKSNLRAYIVDTRSRTWAAQDRAGERRWPTRYLERHGSERYLNHLARLWRHRLARAIRLPSKPVVDSCLAELIRRESRWDVHATNPRTGAYGLPQALPGSKMASAGPDWADNPATQIRWMVGYVQSRYGGSCAALSFQMANGYY